MPAGRGAANSKGGVETRGAGALRGLTGHRDVGASLGMGPLGRCPLPKPQAGLRGSSLAAPGLAAGLRGLPRAESTAQAKRFASQSPAGTWRRRPGMVLPHCLTHGEKLLEAKTENKNPPLHGVTGVDRSRRDPRHPQLHNMVTRWMQQQFNDDLSSLKNVIHSLSPITRRILGQRKGAFAKRTGDSSSWSAPALREDSQHTRGRIPR